MGVKLVSASAGSVEIVAPTTASNYTATMPAKTGNVMLDGPAFSAYLSATQTVSSATFTKVTINTEEFDTNSNYDNATNYRFTPTVAGYYQVSGTLNAATTANVLQIVTIYKNGTEFKRGVSVVPVNGGLVNVSALVYLNGSTDYIELYGYINTGTSFTSGSTITYFQAAMIRGA